MMLSLTLSLAMAVAAGAGPASEEWEFHVPYHATPGNVVAEMLKVANVTKDDVVYDLGSGDGRIVIAAAKLYGARATGIEIDPKRVRQARESALKAGVADRVTFIEGDIFKVDISEASVVTLYLLPAVNEKLRPRLLGELRPGPRIVSHNYGIGDWKPEKRIRVSFLHTIYFWVVPPRAAGR
jgi:ribosomal protein L11 methylase PrmA